MRKLTYGIALMMFFLLSNTAYAAKKTIGIIVFDGVLTSDIISPAEVFGVATRKAWFTDYDVKFIGINDQKNITTEEGITIKVDTNIHKPQTLAALIVPSSYSMKPLISNKTLISFIKEQSTQTEWVSSNCSGALLLAEAGVLDGKKATTWAGGESDFQKQYPAVKVQSDKNYVVDGNIITSNGSVVSYTAAIKLLSLMSSKKLAQEVFDTVQLGRLVSTYEEEK